MTLLRCDLRVTTSLKVMTGLIGRNPQTSSCVFMTSARETFGFAPVEAIGGQCQQQPLWAENSGIIHVQVLTPEALFLVIQQQQKYLEVLITSPSNLQVALKLQKECDLYYCKSSKRMWQPEALICRVV